MQNPRQNYLCMFLDVRLTFEEHLKIITTKVRKLQNCCENCQKNLPKAVLMTIYKAYVRPHLNYNEANYDEAYNETFIQKLESIQHNACLALLGGIRGFSREKLYQKLGLESLQR